MRSAQYKAPEPQTVEPDYPVLALKPDRTTIKLV